MLHPNCRSDYADGDHAAVFNGVGLESDMSAPKPARHAERRDDNMICLYFTHDGITPVLIALHSLTALCPTCFAHRESANSCEAFMKLPAFRSASAS